jgi:hypothetical protein
MPITPALEGRGRRTVSSRPTWATCLKKKKISRLTLIGKDVLDWAADSREKSFLVYCYPGSRIVALFGIHDCLTFFRSLCQLWLLRWWTLTFLPVSHLKHHSFCVGLFLSLRCQSGEFSFNQLPISSPSWNLFSISTSVDTALWHQKGSVIYLLLY